MISSEQIIKMIETIHSGDKAQLDIIFNKTDRLIVEAPAGHGKTKTMISKIAYLLANNELPNPKKILALTFSVNAAFKIKKDVAEQLPKLLNAGETNPIKVNEKVFVSNYHGFCRHVLKLYGYLLHSSLKNIDSLISVDEGNVEEIVNLKIVEYPIAQKLSNFSEAIKGINTPYIKEHMSFYVGQVINSFLPKGYIPYNAIILLTIYLFNYFPKILKFYQNYFPIIIVDEFQDTNLLSWQLLKKLINQNTKLLFMGDSLQRIYGFIGAIPNLIDRAEDFFEMDKIRLTQNYRFKDNSDMLLLDKNIRLNAEKPNAPKILEDANIGFKLTNNQLEEASWVVHYINSILVNNSNARVAVLVKQRGKNIDKIMEVLKENDVQFFYGLFSDEDKDYLKFHRECSFHFSEFIKRNSRITKVSLNKFLAFIKRLNEDNNKPIITSLVNLLEVFLSRIIEEYSFLDNDERIILIKDTFENKALKQNMEHIDLNIIVSTVHGAKGLEWDYVIMPDMEQNSFPNYFGLCGKCGNYSGCSLNVNSSIEQDFLEELSVFYVGVTRAKKQIYFSGSKTRLNQYNRGMPTKISCFLRLPGIKLNSL